MEVAPKKAMEFSSTQSKEWKSMELETETQATPSPASKAAAENPMEQLFERLYGKMTWEEKLRLLWLSSTLFFIIGGYWLLRSLKDPVIAVICGVEYIPKAKMLSVVVVTVFVFIYNKLIDLFPKHQLFYIVGGFYSVVFCGIAAALASPATSSLSIYNTTASPTRLIGWISYCAIESFGSIGVSLFWAFTNSTYNLEGAKKAYGLMVACAQLGSIAGPTVVALGTETYGVPVMYLCGAACMVAMVASIWGYVQRFGPAADDVASTNGATKKKDKTGMMEGLVLFWKYHYVKGIFALSCLFMVEVTILDYSMKVLAKAKFDGEHPGDPTAATAAFAAFMGVFGQAANGLSFVFSLVGTSFIIRRLGLKTTLVFFPSLCLAAICLVYVYPTLEMVFLMMLVLKGLSYSLNNPCKEILYQPTSQNIKFKAKSWIDVFGARGSKALGSVVTNAFSDSAADLLCYGSFVSMGVSGFLIYVSMWIGGQFDVLVASGVKLGEEAEEPQQTPTDDDTSCGVDEEGQTEAPGDKKPSTTEIAV
ncbi:ADP/ATP carrier protein [Pelagophyceae sp. CCMP2097]|nr:ADP/ATP carrier protein [Pelagophyceae sp. CCMP2097]